ncbi:MAG: DUF2334 domain-containing protein [Bacteroidetes bacterium]|nr:MAG: DUF2334 domain-containing protein [Bacteroidota bacterium]
MKKVTGLLLLFIGVLLLLNLNVAHRFHTESTQIKPGTLLLMADDWNVNNWYKYKDSFEKYGLKLTFYVSHIHTMDSMRLAKLRVLQSEGHEIAFHTLNHHDAQKYVQANGLQEYLKVEVDSGLALFRKAGFTTKAFAFPCGSYASAYFPSMRQRFQTLRLNNFPLHQVPYVEDSVKFIQPHNFMFSCFALDDAYGFDQAKLSSLLEEVQKGETVALLFHSIGEDSPWSMSEANFRTFLMLYASYQVRSETVSGFFKNAVVDCSGSMD